MPLAVTTGDHGGRVPAIPRFTLPLKSIDQWPTYVGLEAMRYVSPMPSSLFDGVAIDRQATLILPSMQGVGGRQESETRPSLMEGSVSEIRALVKSSGMYALSSLVAPFLTLLLAPFLTHALSHTDYGALAVLTTVIALVSGVTQLGVAYAFFRAYTDDESQRAQLDVLSTTSLLLLCISATIAITVLFAAPWIAEVLLNDASLANTIRLASVVVLIQNLTVPGLSWLRAENRAGRYSMLSVVNLLITAGATVFLVGVVHMGMDGSLIATASGSAFIVLCTLPVIFVRAGMRFRYAILWRLITFGFPHVINLLSGWVLQLSDRYLLAHFGSLSQAASYAVAYSLGGIASTLIIAPFSLAWWTLMYSIAKREDAARIFQLVFRWFSLVLLFASFGLSMCGFAALDLFFPSAYHAAGSIMPIISLSMLFNGSFTVLSLGIYIRQKTWYAAVLITVSASFNFGLNMFLIPSYGAMGAAVSTLIAYAVLALLGYIVNQRLYRVPFEVGRFGTALLIGIGLYVACNFLAHCSLSGGAWGIRIGGVLLYGICLAVLGKLPIWEKHHRMEGGFFHHESRVA